MAGCPGNSMEPNVKMSKLARILVPTFEHWSRPEHRCRNRKRSMAHIEYRRLTSPWSRPTPLEERPRGCYFYSSSQLRRHRLFASQKTRSTVSISTNSKIRPLTMTDICQPVATINSNNGPSSGTASYSVGFDSPGLRRHTSMTSSEDTSPMICLALPELQPVHNATITICAYQEDQRQTTR